MKKFIQFNIATMSRAASKRKAALTIVSAYNIIVILLIA